MKWILTFYFWLYFFYLQKYRLHTRRPSPSPQAAGGPTPQLVVLGGIWVPPEYAAGGHNGPTALYSPASHAPTHYCATPMPQDFYTTAQQPQQSGHHQLHHHTLHHQLHVYRASTTSRTQSSPESDLRGNGDQSESIEDGKSESGSWKAGTESGEKDMAARRSEDREDSNGSQITLKFWSRLGLGFRSTFRATILYGEELRCLILNLSLFNVKYIGRVMVNLVSVKKVIKEKVSVCFVFL